jgi:hypothetical protein
MTRVDTPSRFKAKLRRPQTLDNDSAWAFVVLPKAASATPPRRGRTTITGSINGHPFQATLEPDGQLTLRRTSQSSGHRVGTVCSRRKAAFVLPDDHSPTAAIAAMSISPPIVRRSRKPVTITGTNAARTTTWAR